VQGILSLFLGELAKYGLRPNVQALGNTLKFEISEAEFKEALMKGVPDNVKRYINISLEKGKIVIEIRLF